MLSLCSHGTFKNGWFRVNGTPKRKNFQAVENSCERNLTQTKKNNFARVSRLFVYFFALTARLRLENVTYILQSK